MNPFEAPAAEIGPAETQSSISERQFVAISIPKLVVLTVFSFGTYEAVWFYRNFRQGYGRVGSFFATVFAGITCFELFRIMEMFAIEQQIRPKFRSAVAGGFVLGIGVANWLVPQPFSLLTPFVSIIPLAVVQSTLNAALAKAAPGADRNTRFGIGTIATIAIGSIFWMIVIAGLLIPTDEQ